jgi:hypothetical protein
MEQAAEAIETASSRKFQTDNAVVQEVRIRRRVHERGKNPVRGASRRAGQTK